MRSPTKPGGAPAAGQAGSHKLGAGMVRLLQAPAVVALAAALAVSSPAPAPGTPGSSEPLCNLPPTLSAGEEGGRQGESNRIRHPKSAGAARCTSKCVSTCVLGGYGAPGVAGPFNIRRTLSGAGSIAWSSVQTSAICSRTAKTTNEIRWIKRYKLLHSVACTKPLT
ncbi:unnamed protein product [Urochloa humidicola]